MARFWVLLLVLSILGGELTTCWLSLNGYSFSEFEPVYRFFHLTQMVVLILLAGLSYRKIGDAFWQGISHLVLLGLSVSLVGDIINSFLVDLSFILQPQTLLSAVPFAIAHLLYITVFWKLGRGSESSTPMPLLLMTVIAWPPLAVVLWLILVDSSAGSILKWLSFAYAHVVVLMALASLWPLRAWGRAAWVAAAGGFVFLISDAFFGAWLAEGRDRPLWVSQFIWITYFLAQLLLLHVPLIGMRRAGAI